MTTTLLTGLAITVVALLIDRTLSHRHYRAHIAAREAVIERLMLDAATLSRELFLARQQPCARTPAPRNVRESSIPPGSLFYRN